MEEIAKRIRRGRAWLTINSQDHCELTHKSYDHFNYEQHLKMYKQLVDQLVELGGDEGKCYQYKTNESLENGKLADFEMEFILSYPELANGSELK